MKGYTLIALVLSLSIVAVCAIPADTESVDNLLQNQGAPAAPLSLEALRAKWFQRYLKNPQVSQHMVLFTPKQQKLLKERAITIIDRSLRTLPLMGVTARVLELGYQQVRQEVNKELFAMAMQFSHAHKSNGVAHRSRRSAQHGRKSHPKVLSAAEDASRYLDSLTDITLSKIVAPPSILQAPPKVIPHSDIFNPKQLEALDRLTTDARHNLVNLIREIEKATLEAGKNLHTMPAEARKLQVKEGKLIHQASNRLKKEVMDTLHTVQRAKPFLKTQTTAQKNKFLRTIISQTEDHLKSIYVEFLGKARNIAPKAFAPPPPPPPRAEEKEASVKVKRVQVEDGETEVPSAASILGNDDDGKGKDSDNDSDSGAQQFATGNQQAYVNSIVNRAQRTIKKFVKHDVKKAERHVQRHVAKQYSQHVRAGLSRQNKKLLKEVVHKITKYASKKIDAIATDMVEAASLQLGSLSQSQRARIVKKVVKASVAQFKRDVGKVTSTAAKAEDHLSGKGDRYIKEFIMSLREKATQRLDGDFEKAENAGRDLIEHEHNKIADEDSGSGFSDASSAEAADDEDASTHQQEDSGEEEEQGGEADGEGEGETGGDGDDGKADGDDGGENTRSEDDASVTVTQDLLVELEVTPVNAEGKTDGDSSVSSQQGATDSDHVSKAAKWGVLSWATKKTGLDTVVKAVSAVNQKMTHYAETQMLDAHAEAQRRAQERLAQETTARMSNYTSGVHGVVTDFLRNPQASLEAVPKRMDRLEADLRKGFALATHDKAVHAMTGVINNVASRVRADLQKVDDSLPDGDFSKYSKQPDPTASATISLVPDHDAETTDDSRPSVSATSVSTNTQSTTPASTSATTTTSTTTTTQTATNSVSSHPKADEAIAAARQAQVSVPHAKQSTSLFRKNDKQSDGKSPALSS